MITFKQFVSEDGFQRIRIWTALTKLLGFSKDDARRLADWLLAGRTNDELPSWEELEEHYNEKLTDMKAAIWEYGPIIYILLKNDLKAHYDIDLPNV